MNLNWSVQKLQLREIQIRELIKENKSPKQIALEE